MKPPVFDNIRWGELLGWFVALASVLELLQGLPIPEQYKHYITTAAGVLAYVLAYLRNPKTLAWIQSGFRGLPPAPPQYSAGIRTDRSDEI